jgi:hypothetical protein
MSSHTGYKVDRGPSAGADIFVSVQGVPGTVAGQLVGDVKQGAQ